MGFVTDVWNKNNWWYLYGDRSGIVGEVKEPDIDLSAERLLEAYRVGVFPWPTENKTFWYCPHLRGVIDFESTTQNQRMLRKKRNSKYTFTQDRAFLDVIRGCQKQPRKGQLGTWITEDLIRAYQKLFQMGHAKSFECWNEDRLVGGLYGVVSKLNGKVLYFSGESVFGLESDVAKFCLSEAIDWQKSLELQFMDVQMVTSLTQSFGAHYVPASLFLLLIQKNSEPES